jgi:hypothetical protein
MAALAAGAFFPPPSRGGVAPAAVAAMARAEAASWSAI